MSKLLNRPLKAFILYALVVLAMSIPVYHYIVDYIWHDELDEHNEIIRIRTEDGLNKLKLTDAQLANSIYLLNRLEPGINLHFAKVSEVKPDSFYTETRQNQYGNKKRIDRFRGLIAYIQVNGKPLHLTVETNVEEVDETLFAIICITAFFFLLLVSGFIFINRKISQQIWMPFRSTLNKIKDFDLNSQLNVQFEKSQIQEFEELNNTLRRLIQKNISAYRQQKEFTENASHELQTPLAVIKSRLDLLLQNKSLTREQSEVIESLNLPLSRVSRINKNLLLLSKIENQQFSTSETINVSELLHDNLEFLADHLENKQIGVEKYIQEDVIINANRSLIEILLTNLLLNAIRHNLINGRLVIELTEKELIISNTGGKGLNQETLFQRFISSSSSTRSSGLGLAIVKQICSAYAWKIDYGYNNNLHIFTVRF